MMLQTYIAFTRRIYNKYVEYPTVKTVYSQVPIKQVGPNKRVGWRKKAVNLKQVGLLLVEFQKIVPNKQVGWKIC